MNLKNSHTIITLIVIVVILFSCSTDSTRYSFSDDLKILETVDQLTILQNGEAAIAVSGAYQGRVFTSTATGLNGPSIGWYKRNTIIAGNSANLMASIGGESRMWFGPEAGKYALFFDGGVEQIPENVITPTDLNQMKFEVTDQSNTYVLSEGNMRIPNANGFVFALKAKRLITLLNQEEIEASLEISLPEDLPTVAFSVATEIENTGLVQWTKDGGLIAIWDLACIPPSPNSWVIIPTSKPKESITPYFTAVKEGGIFYAENAILYNSDGGYLNKIGVVPSYCRNVFGSYSPERNQLHIVKYSLDNDSIYVNSQWGNSDPYNGDVINVFNGEVDLELDRNWPFYELETSSSAKELMPGEKMKHTQSIYHFVGSKAALNEIAKIVLGVSLNELPNSTDRYLNR